MRNALLPSVPSQLCGFGNNEFQMQNMGIPMQMDNKVNHVNGSSFCMESTILTHEGHLRSGGGFASPYQSLVNYQPAGRGASALRSDNMPHKAMMLHNKLPLPQFEPSPFQDLQTLKNARKRRYETNEVSFHKGVNKTALSEWKKSKRKINKTCSQEPIHGKVKEGQTQTQSQTHSAPVPAARRSQKLGDKITALQKLVSPYGKTDTASVLQEASLYIKVLHDQIQNLFQMMSSSYDSFTAMHSQEMEGNELDLRSMGLCLVPTSIVKQLTREDIVCNHHHD